MCWKMTLWLKLRYMVQLKNMWQYVHVNYGINFWVIIYATTNKNNSKWLLQW